VADLPVVTQSDDVLVILHLQRNGKPFNVAAATAIDAAIVDAAGAAVVASAAMSSGHAEADWANGIVACEWASANTGGITAIDQLWIEVQVTIGGKKRTWKKVQVQGQVDVIP